MSPLATQLSWPHFIEILPLKTQEARLFYLNEASKGHLKRNELRSLIHRKGFERKEIANTHLTDIKRIPVNTFKDPYHFDILGLKDDFLEVDLETTILRELEKFILGFGKGFAFVERVKLISVFHIWYISFPFYIPLNRIDCTQLFFYHCSHTHSRF